MELKNLGENLGFSYLFAGDFEKNETATLAMMQISDPYLANTIWKPHEKLSCCRCILRNQYGHVLVQSITKPP